jgi:hypothetical protein
VPSVEITISAWWAVAAFAQVVWLFGIVRPLWSWLDKRQGRKYAKDYRAHRRWRERAEPVALFLSGPLVWGFWAYDSIDQRRTRRHNARMRAARGEDE